MPAWAQKARTMRRSLARRGKPRYLSMGARRRAALPQLAQQTDQFSPIRRAELAADARVVRLHGLGDGG